MNTDLIASMSSAPATWLNVAELPSPTIGSSSPVFGIFRVNTPACARGACDVVAAVDAHPEIAPSASVAPAWAVKAKYSRRVSMDSPPRARAYGWENSIAARRSGGTYGISRLTLLATCRRLQVDERHRGARHHRRRQLAVPLLDGLQLHEVGVHAQRLGARADRRGFGFAAQPGRLRLTFGLRARDLRFDFRRAQILLTLLDLDLRQHALLDALLVGVGEVDVLDLHADDVDRAAIDRRGDGRVEVVVQRGALLDGA